MPSYLVVQTVLRLRIDFHNSTEILGEGRHTAENAGADDGKEGWWKVREVSEVKRGVEVAARAHQMSKLVFMWARERREGVCSRHRVEGLCRMGRRRISANNGTQGGGSAAA